MTGYITVALILVLGGYFAFLLLCRTLGEGVVVATTHPFVRYLLAVAAAARAAAAAMERHLLGMHRAFKKAGIYEVLEIESPLKVKHPSKQRVTQTPEELFAGRSGEHVDYTLGRHLRKIEEELTMEMREALGRDDIHVAYETTDLLDAPCTNCGQLRSAHTHEDRFGLVCPTDAAARTDDERFTYTHPSEIE